MRNKNGFEVWIADFLENENLLCKEISTIQANIGLKCNQVCRHCHAEASPDRSEMMNLNIMEQIVAAAKRARIKQIDITGGAPELNIHLKEFITKLDQAGCSIKVRTNLTVLNDLNEISFIEFYKNYCVQIIASLPCYLEKNVRAQRGNGVFEKSIEVLKNLNHAGYGIEKDLCLDLVYNPNGRFLAPKQELLTEIYRRELNNQFGIKFNRLLTITNMPMGRFLGDLVSTGEKSDYMQILKNTFNPETLDNIMCRHQICVAWNGTLYDCDFNRAAGIMVDQNVPCHIQNFNYEIHAKRRIVTAEYCFGCTANNGSSCEGSIVLN